LELSILELLDERRSLAYEQIAAVLGARPDAVRGALRYLREQGLVDVVAEVEVAGPNGGARWRLTDAGREELAQWLAD
jgi:predicted ArsR family transcriptional regulator